MHPTVINSFNFAESTNSRKLSSNNCRQPVKLTRSRLQVFSVRTVLKNVFQIKEVQPNPLKIVSEGMLPCIDSNLEQLLNSNLSNLGATTSSLFNARALQISKEINCGRSIKQLHKLLQVVKERDLKHAKFTMLALDNLLHFYVNG